MYRELYEDLRRRPQPWQVAQRIATILPDQPWPAPKKPYWADRWASSMAETFEEAKPLTAPLAVLAALTGTVAPDGANPDAIRVYLAERREDLRMTDDANFKSGRLNRQGRKRAGLWVSHLSRRRYDKLFRLVARLTKYVEELDEQIALADLARFAKIGLAADAPFAAFKSNAHSAAFVAYYTANLARRSLFIAGPQARALDQAAETLLRFAEADPDTNWYAIAHVFPRHDVLARCTLEQRVDLLDRAREKLADIAERLAAQAAENDNLNLVEMIVRRGDDSSTWNALAGSWNKARDLWLASAWSVDPAIADAYLPGKVLRLMAADVAAWHRAKGGGLDPDTKVWAALPRPWAVFSGEATQTRRDMIAACESVGVDPAASGWAKPRPRTAVDEVRDTPETVHGVIVGHPALAAMLRRAGYFAGPSTGPGDVIPGIGVERDEYGFAIGVGR